MAGRHVVDVASGSGLCAIVAMRLGAASAQAVDIDPLAEAAVALNARANGVRIGFSRRDILGDEPPVCDVILAGDVCYEETMAERMIAWLRLAADRGTRVLVGDPGRAYLPSGMTCLATYRVTTSRELENAEVKGSAVYTSFWADRTRKDSPPSPPPPSAEHRSSARRAFDGMAPWPDGGVAIAGAGPATRRSAARDGSDPLHGSNILLCA